MKVPKGLDPESQILWKELVEEIERNKREIAALKNRVRQLERR